MAKIAASNSNEDYCTASGALYYVLRLSQLIFGAPIRFQKYSMGWCIRFSSACAIAILLFTVLFDACFVTIMVINLSSRIKTFIGWDLLMTYDIIRGTSICSVLVAASVMGYGAPRRFKNIIRCLNRLQKINAEMNIASRNERNFVVLCLSYVGFVLCLSVLEHYQYFMLGKSLMTNNTVRLSTLNHFAALWAALTTLIFTCIALEIFATLKSMNDQLETLLLQLQKEKSEFSFHSTFIRKFSSMYDDICMIVEDFDRGYGLEIMALLMNNFIYVIILPHYIFHLLSTKYYQYIIYQLLMMVMYVARLLFIIEPCHMTQREMDRTSLIVSKLSMEHMDSHSAMELEKFTHYLLGHKVAYCPLGMCTLNRRLLTTIVTNVTTYLVILIQFQLLDQSKKQIK